MMEKLLPQRFTTATGLARGSATLISRQVLANDEAIEPTRIRKTRVLLVDRTVDEVFMVCASCFETVGFHCPCCPWPMCAVRWHASFIRRGFFSISSCPQRRRWLMVLLSFSFVACHNPRFALHDTVHDLSPGRRCIPGFPLWIASGYHVDEAFMHGHSRPVATRTSTGNLHGKDVHLFALRPRPHLSTKIAFICTRGGRFALVAAHADMIDIASFTRLRTDRQTYHSARCELKASLTWLILRQQNRCQCVYGLVARSSCQTGKDCFLTWVDGVKSGWASRIEPTTFRTVYLYHL